MTASKKDEKTCIVVTLNDGNDFEDHKALCESVFNEYERVLLVDKESLNLDIESPEKYYIENDLYALLKEEEKILESDIQKLEDPSYVARYAREKYLYSKDGEIIIRMPDDDE